MLHEPSQSAAVLQIGVAVVISRGRVLVGTRDAAAHLGGLQEFPGGKLLPGEAADAGAVRECFEETGLKVQGEGLLHQETFQYPERTVQLHFYRCRPVYADLSPNPPFRWVSLTELSQLEFPEGNRRLLQLLQQEARDSEGPVQSQRRLKSVCVFCGSRTGEHPVFAEAARELGRRLAEQQWHLVFGGGHIGLMGVVADAALKEGGTATGVIPESLQRRELAHPGVADMRIVDSMHTRKALMAELADAFVALPGGLGTFEELCEILTWGQLGFHSKPVVILNINDYYAPLLQLIDSGIAAGFMQTQHRRLFHVAASVSELVEWLQQAPQGESDSEKLWQST